MAMEKYTVIKAFSVLEKVLLVPEDEVYAEEALANRYRVFNAKTRKLIGLVSEEKFKASVKESKDFKIYDNTEAKETIVECIKNISKMHKSKLVKLACYTIEQQVKTSL